LRRYLHVMALVLGAIALLTAQMADTARARGLYSAIAMGPVLAGLISIYRYRVSSGSEKSYAKIIVECAWVCLSFGLGFWMMLPSRYYAVQPVVGLLLGIEALFLAVVGLYGLVTLGRMGFSLTP